MQKIIPHLWFDKNAEEAMNYYVEVFKGSPAKEAADSEIINIVPYPDGYTEGPMAGMAGKVLNGAFKLAGVQLYALDGGPIFKFNESISLYVGCEDQDGEWPSGKAPGFGPGIRGFESLLPSHAVCVIFSTTINSQTMIRLM
jgi:predicted 3-demethylubiquinone-9 3-methyltransferase (glyoxalase superfamily)